MSDIPIVPVDVVRLIRPNPVLHVQKTGRKSQAGTMADRSVVGPGPQLRVVVASLTASAWLFGCAALPQQAPLSEVARACLRQNRGFTDAWGCIQARYAAADPVDTAPWLRTFLRLGDSLAMQVAARTLNEASARARLAANLPGERKTIVDGVRQLVRSLRITGP